MNSGRFITFEGPEGSGKSTHIKLLADRLQASGLQVVVTREPGGTALGAAIRNLLQHDVSNEVPVPRTETLLFLADRAQHVEQVIRPALTRGIWVLCDRYEDSTLAYQGWGRGLELEKLRLVNAFATEGLKPDLTIMLDLNLCAAQKRLHQRNHHAEAMPDRIESENTVFHERLRVGFRELAKEFPERFVVFDTDHETAEVAELIFEAVKQRWPEIFHAF